MTVGENYVTFTLW